MAIKNFDPYGVNPKSGTIQDTMHTFYQGDTLRFKLTAEFPDGTKANESSAILFTLVDKRYDHGVIWSAKVSDGGVTLLKDGVVEIAIPKEISDKLRRGSFLFSLRISKNMNTDIHTTQSGTLLIEYGADAPTPTVGYK